IFLLDSDGYVRGRDYGRRRWRFRSVLSLSTRARWWCQRVWQAAASAAAVAVSAAEWGPAASLHAHSDAPGGAARLLRGVLDRVGAVGGPGGSARVPLLGARGR